MATLTLTNRVSRESLIDPDIALLGLRHGQVRGVYESIAPSSGWYNRHGRLRGIGDLSALDFINIVRGLEKCNGGPFIIVLPRDGRPRIRTLPVHEVIDICTLIVVPGCVCIIDAFDVKSEAIFDAHKIPSTFFDRRDAHQLIGGISVH